MLDSNSNAHLLEEQKSSSRTVTTNAKLKNQSSPRKSSKKSTQRKTTTKKDKLLKKKSSTLPTKGSKKLAGITEKGKTKRRVDNNNSDIDDTLKDTGRLFREGQKYITPPNGDATRAFYESLYEENPYSIIALKYCVENGVLLGNKHAVAHSRLEFLRERGFLKRSIGGLQEEAIKHLRLFDDKKCGFREVRTSP